MVNKSENLEKSKNLKNPQKSMKKSKNQIIQKNLKKKLN